MKRIICGVISLSSTLLYGFEVRKPETYTLKYLHNLGDIDGFVQVPKGGQFGTTTPKKPEFGELGVKEINHPEFELSAKWDDFFIYTGVNYNTFKGDSILKENLISHNQVLLKGAPIKTKHKYINYEFGLGYDIYETERLVVSPKLEFNAMQFEYQYDSKNLVNQDVSSGRKFGFGSVHIGIDTAYSVTEKYKVELKGKYAIPFDSIRKWFSLELLNKYTIYKNEKQEVNALLGVEFGYFEYKDTQDDMQNYLKYKFSPLYKAGIEYIF